MVVYAKLQWRMTCECGKIVGKTTDVGSHEHIDEKCRTSNGHITTNSEDADLSRTANLDRTGREIRALVSSTGTQCDRNHGRECGCQLRGIRGLQSSMTITSLLVELVLLVLDPPPPVRRLEVALPIISEATGSSLSASPAAPRLRLPLVCLARAAFARVFGTRSSSESSMVMTVLGGGLREEEPLLVGTGVARLFPLERVLGIEGAGATAGTGAGGDGGGGGFAYNRVHSRAVRSC